MNKCLLLTSVFALTFPGYCQDYYIVKRGDTLSQIVSANYPAQKLYGENGKLLQVLSLNPDIKNQHLIFPRQHIILENNRRITSDTLETYTPVSSHNEKEQWQVSVLGGVKFLSLSQKGALDAAKVGQLFEFLKLGAEFHFLEVGVFFDYETYKFKTHSVTPDSHQLHSTSLKVSYDNILAGVLFDQNPLFKTVNSLTEMTTQTTLSLLAGYSEKWSFGTRKPTILELSGVLSYPLSSFTDDPKIRISSVYGFGVLGKAALARELFSNNSHKLKMVFDINVQHQKTSQNVKWEDSKGNVDTKILNFSTALGLSYSF